MNENGFNNFGGQEGRPNHFSGQNNQPNQPGTQQTPPYGCQPDMQQPNMDGQQGEAPKPPKKKRKFPKAFVSAVAGVVAGGLLTAFVIMRRPDGQAALPAQQLPTREEQTQEQGTGETPSLGGEAQSIQNVQNPAVEIAENISGSVVGITAYNKQLVSGQEPVEQALDAGTGFVISEAGGLYPYQQPRRCEWQPH